MKHRTVEIVEVGPRDGLQNEKTLLSTQSKIAFIEKAVSAGLRRIEVTSFVNPKRVPQMADAEELVAGLPHRDDTIYVALVLNRRGAERAIAAGIRELNFAMTVTTTFNERNQRAGVTESISEFGEVAALARSAGARATIMLGASFGCPFEGEVPVERISDVVSRVMEFSPSEIGLADTIGVATPFDVKERIAAVKNVAPETPLRCHFHNTRNTGLANAVASVEMGVTALDSSIGGIGGCPFSPRATGNIATEDLLYLLQRMNLAPPVSMTALLEAAKWLEAEIGRGVPSALARAGAFPKLNQLLPI